MMPSCLVAAGPRNQQCRRNTTSGLLGLFSDVTLFRMSKCICKPNFVDTPQSTADITIFCIKKHFCIGGPNFLQISQPAAEV